MAGKGTRGGARDKLRQLGRPAGSGSAAAAKPKQVTFEIFFPRPGSGTPYRGAQYCAARGKDGLYNFVGLVLGHGGATVQRIQRSSGAKIEVRDSAGNLNGAHPSSHGDPSLHAWVAASSRQRLQKAVQLLLDVLAPTNTSLRPVTVLPGACAVLEPVVPSDWPEAAEATAAEQPQGAASKAAAGKAGAPRPPAAPAVNAWASNRLLRQHGQSQQATPPASPQAQQPEEVLDRTDSGHSTATAGASSEDDTAAAAVDPCKGFGGGLESPASVVPPPPPPRRRQTEAPPAAPPAAAPAAVPAPAQASAPVPAALPLVHQAGQAAPQVQGPMTTVWAKGLHPQDSQQLETPATPCGATERATPLAPERTATGSSTASWSLWDAGSSGLASSFYEELQAAAVGLGPAPAAAPAPSALARGLAQTGPRQLLHSNSWPQSHSQADRASLLALHQHQQALSLPPPAPHALAAAAAPQQLAVPFLGLGRSASGLAQPLGSYSMHLVHGVVGAHSVVSGLAAAHSAGVPALPLRYAAGSHTYPALTAEPSLASMPSVLDQEMQHLLAAVASMATLE
ncbi:hypothetical protein ABPG75_013419 [Micractinium tetrahymenae]